MREVPPRGKIWAAVWLGAVGAGIAALVVALAVTRGYEQRLQALDGEAALLRAELERQQAFVGMLRDPATRGVALAGAGPSPGARGRVMWHPTAGGFLLVAGLPPAPAGTAYQLWALAGRQPPMSAGVFTVDPRGAGSLRLSPLPAATVVDGFVVTLEVAGGAPAPSGPAYLVTGR